MPGTPIDELTKPHVVIEDEHYRMVARVEVEEGTLARATLLLGVERRGTDRMGGLHWLPTDESYQCSLFNDLQPRDAIGPKRTVAWLWYALYRPVVEGSADEQ